MPAPVRRKSLITEGDNFPSRYFIYYIKWNKCIVSAIPVYYWRECSGTARNIIWGLKTEDPTSPDVKLCYWRTCTTSCQEKAVAALCPLELHLMQRGEHRQAVPPALQNHPKQQPVHNRQWQHLCGIGKNRNHPHLQNGEKRKQHQMTFVVKKNRPYITSNDNCFTLLAPGSLSNSW